MLNLEKLKTLYKDIMNPGKWEYILRSQGQGESIPIMKVCEGLECELRDRKGRIFIRSHKTDYATHEFIVEVVNSFPDLAAAIEDNIRTRNLLNQNLANKNDLIHQLNIKIFALTEAMHSILMDDASMSKVYAREALDACEK